MRPANDNDEDDVAYLGRHIEFLHDQIRHRDETILLLMSANVQAFEGWQRAIDGGGA